MSFIMVEYSSLFWKWFLITFNIYLVFNMLYLLRVKTSESLSSSVLCTPDLGMMTAFSRSRVSMVTRAHGHSAHLIFQRFSMSVRAAPALNFLQQPPVVNPAYSCRGGRSKEDPGPLRGGGRPTSWRRGGVSKTVREWLGTGDKFVCSVSAVKKK